MTAHDPETGQPEVIGLIPAGGQATRISPLPCSKELYPVSFQPLGKEGGLRPKVVCHYLLERMRRAGVTKAYIVLRPGKWDIPAYLGDGAMIGMHLAYLTVHVPFGTPYTLDQAYPFVNNTLVALGFPDIMFQPEDTFVQLLARQTATQADVVLGLFPATQPQTCDMVDVGDDGRIRQIIVKPRQTQLRYTWMTAVWTPVFTQFMHKFLASIQTSTEGQGNAEHGQRELFIGDVIQAAIDAGLHVKHVLFPQGTYLDIGTPDGLAEAVDRSMT